MLMFSNDTTGCRFSIHPSSLPPELRVKLVSWILSQLSQGEVKVIPWTSFQLVTQPHRDNKMNQKKIHNTHR